MTDPIVQAIIAREMPHARIMDPEEIKALRQPKDPRPGAQKRKDVIQGPSAEAVIRKWGSSQPNLDPKPIPQDEMATVVVVYPKGRQETVIVNKTTGQIVATSG